MTTRNDQDLRDIPGRGGSGDNGTAPDGTVSYSSNSSNPSTSVASVGHQLKSKVRAYLTSYQELRRRIGLRWWIELLLIGIFYLVYSIIRNFLGSASVGWENAFNNAQKVIDIERYFGLFQELRIQNWFIDWELFIRFWNIFYGLCHFAVTGLTLIWLYVRFPSDFPRWRTIGLLTTGLGLIGFALFPLMPPRLLGASIVDLGAGMPEIYPFVDTMRQFGGLWEYSSGAVGGVSNQYAAMPSLHFAWAVWCCAALLPKMRMRSARTLVAAYPVATLFAIVVTANHFWLDAVGGIAVFAVGYFIGSYAHRHWWPKLHRWWVGRDGQPAKVTS